MGSMSCKHLAETIASMSQEADWVFDGVAERWQTPYGDTTVGLAVLDNRGLFRENWWRWVGMAVLLGYAILFNILVLLAQTYLGRESPVSCVMPEEYCTP